MVASQTQGAASLSFTLDPDQNRIASSTDGSTTTVDHYSDDSDSPAWTETGTDWTRNITGIDGGLAATSTQDGTVTLQLANPHGDIVATAADDPAATGIASYSETTEYGTPRDSASASDSYGWLGSKQRSTDDLAGLTLMGVRLYNPVTGRFLSVDPVPGGNANAYAYPVDPISGYDFDGRCSILCHIAHWANEIIDPTPQVMPNRTWEFLTHHIKAIAATAGIVACTFTGVAACLAISTVATLLANLKGGIRHNSRDLIQEELMNLGGAGAGERLEMMYERYSTRQWLQWVTNRLIPMEGVVAV